MTELPGNPGRKLSAAFEAMNEPEREAFVDHLNSNTPAQWLAEVLTAHGHPVSASTIRSYRRSAARLERGT